MVVAISYTDMNEADNLRSRLRSLGTRVVLASVRAANLGLEKQDQSLIRTYPDFAPNGIAVSNALLRYTDLPVTWLLENPDRRPPLSLEGHERLRFVSYRSLEGAHVFARTRYVFLTHGIYGNLTPAKGQVVVQLWHGMPIKRIGYADRTAAPFTWLVASSPYWRSLLAEVFNIEQRQILSTGMPRDELIMQETTAEARAALHSLIGKRPYERLVIWLPTYRQRADGHSPIDGTERGNTLQSADIDLSEVNRAFASRDSLCIIKTHPASPRYSEPNHSHLVHIRDAELQAVGLDLFTLLGMSDGLVTDLSSVWIDYLVTGKPILFFVPDLDEYRESRGLLHEPYEDFVPTPLFQDSRDLPEAIARLFLDGASYRDRMRDARTKLNSSSNTDSALRLLIHLGLASTSTDG